MRLRQIIAGLGSLVILIGLLAGAPLALAVFAGNPLPDHVPALAEIGDALTKPDDGQLFLRTLAVVGWLGWATFALSVLVEIPARALRIPVPRLPGMRRQQRMAAALVGGVALIIGASPAMASATTLAPAPAVVAAPAYAPAPLVASSAVRDDPGVPVYRVERGDYLGHIADRYLGEFDRYPELAKLNKIRDADVIRPGQMLHLPDGASDSGVRSHATGLVSAPPPATERPASPPRTEAPPTPVVEEEPEVPYVPPPPTVQEESVSGGTGASATRPDQKQGLNLPLAVSAVLTAASLVGAQIGVLLGIRDKRRAARRPR
ncbi:LysM peptidoglycan-binding domain-containing protein [Phytohabitans rumicis]|uniref:LysM domain-containing protein n=1 Tax=Phytohabitans rumicis TaxID=1076125 RepID=A0A6V8L8B4_9ACTN|nr:LysM domain-containing protein [Phytohabitans rumicis]GFJ90356.1 hypothetical protein Prum_039980 [Phytohabitans rumicis]